jgi:hypothetical protein
VQAGVTLARSTADFPDDVGKRCVMTVTIPEVIAARNSTVAPRIVEERRVLCLPRYPFEIGLS